MKNEIKEILDKLKYTAKKHTIQVLENSGKIEYCPQEIETELRLNTYSANKLYDYITNLQEENERLKLELSGYREAILKDDKLLGLQSRIDKAIEYINMVKSFALIDKVNIMSISTLLNILTGGDEE